MQHVFQTYFIHQARRPSNQHHLHFVDDFDVNCAHSCTICLIFMPLLQILSLYYLLHQNTKTFMSTIKPCSSFLTCDSNTNESPYDPNWGIAEPAESINWSNDIAEEKTSIYCLALSWLQSKNIKAGNPDDIVDSFTSKQRENLKASSMGHSIQLSSSSLLSRRTRSANPVNS